MLFGLALVVAACGPSDRRRAFDAYRTQAEALLSRERDTYEQMARLADDGDGGHLRYLDWVRDHGEETYATLLAEARALHVQDPDLVRIHGEFVAALENMLESLRVEVRNRPVVERALTSPALVQLDEYEVVAERAVEAYVAWLDDPNFPQRAPEWRFRRLKDAQEEFRRVDERLRTGEIDAAEAKRELRATSLKILDEIERKEQWSDDEGGRLLAAVAGSARRLYLHLAETDALDVHLALIAANAPRDEARQRYANGLQRYVTQFRTLDGTVR